MYTTKRKHFTEAMCAETAPPKPTNYMHVAEPYDKPKPKKDPNAKKLVKFRSAKNFTPTDGTYLGKDDGCFSRHQYIKQGYFNSNTYADKGFHKDKKAQTCLRGAPFGSKGNAKRDEFHHRIREQQYRELLKQEQRFEKVFASREAERQAKEAAAAGGEAASAAATVTSPKRKKKYAFDQFVAGGDDRGFDNSWKNETKKWIKKKPGARPIEHGSMKPVSAVYGNFDTSTMERPKFARVSVTRDFNDISHLS